MCSDNFSHLLKNCRNFFFELLLKFLKFFWTYFKRPRTAPIFNSKFLHFFQTFPTVFQKCRKITKKIFFNIFAINYIPLFPPFPWELHEIYIKFFQLSFPISQNCSNIYSKFFKKNLQHFCHVTRQVF